MSMDKYANNKLPSIPKDYLYEIKEMNSKVNSSSNLLQEEEKIKLNHLLKNGIKL